MTIPPDRPLTDAEFDELASFLAACSGGRAMSLEALDGFFAALIVGPDVVLPSEYWPVVLGGPMEDVAVFDSGEHANRVLMLFMRHWNTIAATLHSGSIYEPLFLSDTGHSSPGTEWADGFMRGVDMRAAEWQPLIDDAQHHDVILSIMMLAQDKDCGTDPYVKALSAENRRHLLAATVLGLRDIQNYFRARGRSGAAHSRPVTPEPFRHTSPKVGRNDRCPCSSGRKYKHCCGAHTDPPLH